MIRIVSEGRPKGENLKKPDALKGISPFISYKWGGSTACPAFIKGNDVWIKHRDWRSLTLYNRPAVQGKKRFIYADSFTAPTIRGESWIVMENVLAFESRAQTVMKIADECMLGKDSPFCMDDCRMFQDIYISAYQTRYGNIRNLR